MTRLIHRPDFWRIEYQLLKNKIMDDTPKRFLDCQHKLDRLNNLIPKNVEFEDVKFGNYIDYAYRKDVDYIKFKNRHNLPSGTSSLNTPVMGTGSLSNPVMDTTHNTIGSNTEVVQPNHGHVEPYVFSSQPVKEPLKIKSNVKGLVKTILRPQIEALNMVIKIVTNK